MAFNFSIPLPPALQAAFDAIVAEFNKVEDAAVKAADAAAPGSGGAIRAAIATLEPGVVVVLDAAAIMAKGTIELSQAIKTLHAFAKPDVTDAG